MISGCRFTGCDEVTIDGTCTECHFEECKSIHIFGVSKDNTFEDCGSVLSADASNPPASQRILPLNFARIVVLKDGKIYGQMQTGKWMVHDPSIGLTSQDAASWRDSKDVPF